MDVNRIGTKLDTIRFTSDSDPLHFNTKVFVYTERIDNLCGGAPWTLARSDRFPFFLQFSKAIVGNFF